ncbi:MAG: GNAT family N-acetyltransferase [Candidatus Tumulicola sp.]
MIRIERASMADLDELLGMVASYRVFYGRDSDSDRERAYVAGHLQNGSSVIFLARDDRGDPVGFMQLFQTFSTVRLGPSLILEDMFVVPRARRAGVASALLDRADEYAREIGAVGMSLETATDNAAAQRAYERAGWTRESQFYKYNAPL